MERRMETKEPTWIGTVTQNRNGQGIRFLAASEQLSTVVVQLAYTPEGVVEHVGDGVDVLSVRVQKELERFKAFVESCSQETGNWLNSLPYHAFSSRPTATRAVEWSTQRKSKKIETRQEV